MFKVSVVMSVYNGGKYLKEAVLSVLQQTYRDFELIIINDGSTDDSLNIIKELQSKDDRIKIVSRENKGLVCSLNEGVRMAQGEYIARMDADDLAGCDRFEKQLKYMQENNLVVCGSWAEGIDSAGKNIKDMDYPPNTKKIRFYALWHNPFIHPAVMFKKDIFEKNGGYRKSFKHIEDYELWTRLVFKYKTGNIPERLIKYRLHDDQITRENNLEMRLKGVWVRTLAFFRFIFRF